MHLYLEIAGDQIEGGRGYQEDAFLISYVDEEGGKPKTNALLVMADGMGGHAAGNIASQLVVNTFNRIFTSKFGSDDIPRILSGALDKSNSGLADTVKETPALEGMGCTMVTGAISLGKIWWISVGDSHLYLVRDGKLKKLNEDHSYGGYLDRMEAAGTPVEPEPGLARNMLRSAVMGDEIPEIDCPDEPFDLKDGDRVIISSDGLDTLSNDTVLKVASGASNPKDCVANLLQAVEDAQKPRQDNTTVIVADVIKHEDEAAPAPVDTGAPEPERGPSNLGPLLAKLAVALVVIGGIAAAALFVDWGALVGAGKERVVALTADAPEPAPADDDAARGDATEPEAETEAPDDDMDAAAAPDEVTETPVAEAEEPSDASAPFRDRLRSGGHGPEIVRLPGGTFLMGTNEGGASPSMRPQHEVSVRPFAIMTHEATFAEYERFARATGRRIPPSDGVDKTTFPAFGVSWEDALAYAQWLSRETGHRYALPTESQWEYAATTGRPTAYWWGYAAPRDRAHCFGCTPGLHPRMPVQVGRFDPNPFGLYDTVGNVAEWVHDCFHDNYKGAPSDDRVWEGGNCSVRVIRGGHYASPNPAAQTRDTRPPGRGYPDVGIRLVRYE